MREKGDCRHYEPLPKEKSGASPDFFASRHSSLAAARFAAKELFDLKLSKTEEVSGTCILRDGPPYLWRTSTLGPQALICGQHDGDPSDRDKITTQNVARIVHPKIDARSPDCQHEQNRRKPDSCFDRI